MVAEASLMWSAAVGALFSLLLSQIHCWQASQIQADPGHYPYFYCKITNVFFNWQTQFFHYTSPVNEHNEKCPPTDIIWDIENSLELDMERCDVIYDHGYVFPIFAKYGGNYYHLHYDTLIPLYSEIYYKNSVNGTLVFMPCIEKSRMQKMEWETGLFIDDRKFWNQLMQIIAGKNTLLPLDSLLLHQKKNICFKHISFGTTRTAFHDKKMIRSFVEYVHQTVKPSLSMDHLPRVGIISRSNRRRILNEEDLVNSLSEFVETELVHFEGNTIKAQIEAVQRYTVLAGINGAGLMNCMYLPASSVCIQMVPYEAHVNWEEFRILLQARGPYLEWHNTHQNLTRRPPGDTNNNRPDTIVHVKEFTAIVKQALREASAKSMVGHEEL